MRRWGIGSALALLAVTLTLLLGSDSARADRRDFTLVNRSGVTIFEVYVGPSHEPDWGDDILGSDVIIPGESLDVYFSRYDGNTGSCLYDIRVVGADGSEGVLYEVNLCTTTTVTFR
ncbi:MAG: hypothetical protein U0531_22085 [Dehalococcoidia bacterium]